MWTRQVWKKYIYIKKKERRKKIAKSNQRWKNKRKRNTRKGCCHLESWNMEWENQRLNSKVSIQMHENNHYIILIIQYVIIFFFLKCLYNLLFFNEITFDILSVYLYRLSITNFYIYIVCKIEKIKIKYYVSYLTIMINL